MATTICTGEALSMAKRQADLDHLPDVGWRQPEFPLGLLVLLQQVADLRRGNITIELFQLADAAPLPESRKNPSEDFRTHGVKHFGFEVKNLPAVLAELKAKGVKIAFEMRDIHLEHPRPHASPEVWTANKAIYDANRAVRISGRGHSWRSLIPRRMPGMPTRNPARHAPLVQPVIVTEALFQAGFFHGWPWAIPKDSWNSP